MKKKEAYVVCVIDDDKVYQFATTMSIEMLEKVKETMVFSDGEEAIDFFEQNAQNTEALPDIILLDLNMPIMDGWQFLDEFVELKCKKDIIIYVVLSSNDTIDTDRVKKIEEVSGYFVKPLNPKELEQILLNL